MYGESNPSAVFTTDQIEEIRLIYQPMSRGVNGSSALARRFNVSRSTLVNAAKGTTYGDVRQEPVSYNPNVCAQGHEKTPENTYTFKNLRLCKICRRLNDKRKYLRLKNSQLDETRL